MKKKWMKTMLVLACCVAAMLGFSGCGTSKINLKDYVEVSFAGYDGYGTVYVILDKEAIDEKYGKKMNLTNSATFWGYTSSALAFTECCSVSASPATGLSNGDEVTIVFDVDEDYLNYFLDVDFEISTESTTVKVSGLEEVSTGDVFENVTVTFSGTAPSAAAELTVPDNMSAYWFTMDQSTGLDKGDVVTVSISEDYISEIVAATGMAPSEMSKEYEVEGVAHYVSSIDEIPEDIMNAMQSQAMDAFNAHAASKWGESEELLSSDYLGSYLLVPKDGMNTSHNNMLYLVYKVTVKNDATDSLTYYRYCRFSDIIVLEDGTCSVDLSDYDEPSGSVTLGMESGDVVRVDHFYYQGFADLTTLFNRCVTENIDVYTYESTVEE